MRSERGILIDTDSGPTNFDAAIVFVTNSSLLFRLAVDILCKYLKKITNNKINSKTFCYTIHRQFGCGVLPKMGL